MRNQIVQWIFLPGGLTEEGLLAASIFVAPRLRSDEGSTLADFPDFLDWPTTLDQMTVLLQRDDGDTQSPMRFLDFSSSELWRALFTPDTLVRPFAFDDYADRPMITYPVDRVLDYIKGQWASAAAMNTDDLPFSSFNASPIGPMLDGELLDAHTLAPLFTDLMDANRMGIFEGAPGGEEVSRRMADALRGAAQQAAALRAQHSQTPQPMIQPFFQSSNPAGNFYQLATFHRRPEAPPAEFPRDAEAARAMLDEKMEFHHLLSTLGDHPELLRALGLAFDLIINPDFLPTLTDQDPPSHLRAIISRPSAFPTGPDPAVSPWNVDVMPWTQCRLALTPDIGATFSAAELTGSQDFAHGFVRMDPARFAMVSTDVDGLALKALSMATTLETQEAQSQRPVEEDARAGTPAPRTGGIALALSGRAQALHDDFYLARKANDDLENDPTNPPILTAEQLVRGYRMDVFDGSAGEWRSLHARIASYTPLRSPGEAFSVEDEGFVQVSLAGEADLPDAPADPDGAVYVHETLITWDGWSLAAQRPGMAIPQEPAPPPASADFGALQLDLGIRAMPSSLPRLRFGSSYRLRLRAVDLAGRSHPLERGNNLGDLLDSTGLPEYRVTLPMGEFTYRRLEPVPPPELVPRHIFSPGEGLERLVIRSNRGLSTEQYAAASQSAADEMLRFRAICDRHVAPAKTSLQLAEVHGMFDEAIETARGLPPGEAAAAVEQFYQIAVRENGSFRDHPSARFVATGTHQEQEQGYVTIDADAVTLPYLPDPFCGGILARLQVSPVEPEDVFEIQFRQVGDWHELRPIRLRLEDGSLAAHFNESQSLLTVRVPPGRVARMRLNSLFLNDPELFEVMAWCRERLSSFDVEAVFEAIRRSRHWMTTPWRTLHFVHAVQQPLEEPQLDLPADQNEGFRRFVGATAADLTGTVFLDCASTAALDLVAEWDDVMDDPAVIPLDVEDMTRHTRANAFQIVIPEPFGTPWGPEIKPFLEALDSDGGQEWTRVGFTTFSDQTELLTAQKTRADLLGRSADPSLPVQARNQLAASAVQLEGLRSHEFGDTKYRRVSYQMVASTRFREYFDPAMPVEAGIRRGDVVTVDVLNSAPPLAPVVLDVVPIMRWHRTETAGGDQIESARQSAGLRVWLARPWFSSGAGEMLGLICGSGGPMTPETSLYREMTVISQDPAFASVLPQPLRVESFPAADRVEMDVRLPMGGLVMDVAAFHPRYDEARDAWYCDINIEMGETYLPFVRLGLVRFQPNSLRACHVSSIVPTTFLQPLPDRTLTVVRQGADSVFVTLRGPGPAARQSIDGSMVIDTNAVTASIEAQDPNISDPALGWLPAGPEVFLQPAEFGATMVEWTGMVAFPAESAHPLRLTVREFELHPTDDRSSVPPSLVLGRRLVHADVVPL